MSGSAAAAASGFAAARRAAKLSPAAASTVGTPAQCQRRGCGRMAGERDSRLAAAWGGWPMLARAAAMSTRLPVSKGKPLATGMATGPTASPPCAFGIGCPWYNVFCGPRRGGWSRRRGG
jgi:hypothetical protein